MHINFKAVMVLSLVLSLSAGAAWAAKAVAKPAAKPAPAVTQAAAVAPAEPAAEANIEAMKPGLAYNFDMDFKLFNLSNPNFASSNGTSSWYFYPTYRAVLSNVFANGFAVLADIEKPGYANVTYPTLKVNELYAKYQQGTFYLKLGRQIYGDTSDLLLGFQNDAIAAGWDLGTIDIEAFIAKTALLLPWGGTEQGLFGVVPKFQFGRDMGLRAYLLIGTESAATNSNANNVNSLITLGGKYFALFPVSDTGKIDVAGQLGLQFAMAQTAGGQSIDATNVGLKLDGEFANTPQNALGFKVGAHIVFTGGVDTAATTPKAPFISPNELIGSGPGLFSKVENGAGPYTYVDSLLGNARVQQYAGVFALGLSGEILVSGFNVGLGFWTYSDNFHYNPAPSTSSLGSEIDQWAGYQIMAPLSVYEQIALYLPPNPANASPAPGSAFKFLLGTALTF
jgi:hypothetical protein